MTKRKLRLPLGFVPANLTSWHPAGPRAWDWPIPPHGTAIIGRDVNYPHKLSFAVEDYHGDRIVRMDLHFRQEATLVDDVGAQRMLLRAVLALGIVAAKPDQENKPEAEVETKMTTAKQSISDRELGRLLREVYQQASWDASGLSASDEEARDMKWDKVARAARRALQKRSG